jgi:hypothetical protein
MEVHFTPEQEAQLAQIASKEGTNPERLVKEVLARYLDDEARFLAAVEKGDSASRSRLVYRGRGDGGPLRADASLLSGCPPTSPFTEVDRATIVT